MCVVGEGPRTRRNRRRWHWRRDKGANGSGTILKKYARLHAAGVVHGSPKPKHWLRPPGAPIDALKIIDFGAALILDGEDVPPELKREWCVLGQEKFMRCVLDEYRDLMRALGL